MSILQRYIGSLLLRNLGLALLVFVFLFLVFDFFDRIDNILAEDAGAWIAIQYFLFKIPRILTLMFPIALMVSILMTMGLLSKSSEITAMRAAGVPIITLAAPALVLGGALSVCAFLIGEYVAPASERRSREIYNIDIRQKDRRGGYSQSKFWWRDGPRLFSVDNFDSRSDELSGLSVFEISPDYKVRVRTDAASARWLNPELGWSMVDVYERTFLSDGETRENRFRSLPLPIRDTPEDFYEVRTEPSTMTVSQLRRFIRQQRKNGIDVSDYLPYLSEKFSFALFNLVIVLIVLPFALRPARSGSMAGSVLAGLVIGFTYYVVHSFSMALGKAELFPPVLSAWVANIIMGTVGALLVWGAESPS